MVRFVVTCSIGLALLFTAGCNKDTGPPKAAVSGKVTLDDEPLAGMEINFYCQEHDFLATGMTGEDGSYELYQGAAIGENKVWLVKPTGVGDPAGGGDPAENPEADPGMMDAAADISAGGEPGKAEGEGALPAKFGDPEASVLKFKVADGGNSAADFALKSE